MPSPVRAAHISPIPRHLEEPFEIIGRYYLKINFGLTFKVWVLWQESDYC